MTENKIKIGIVGYGNLGKGVRHSIGQNPDMELVAVFTRREVGSVAGSDPLMVPYAKLNDYKGKVDVMILCGGSATDLEEQGPEVAAHFNTVDSFDTHARIPEYFEKMNSAASKAKNLSIISVGWDPGLFSLNRLLGHVVLPQGKDYTFWGPGVSQGHSDAVRRIAGVKRAVQYTLPIESALEKVRDGSNPDFSAREKHTRLCYVVTEEGADQRTVASAIKTMPNYFAEYDTEVRFITEAEFDRDHAGIPHGGFNIRTGQTGSGAKQKMEFALALESNPEFTSSVLVPFARAIAKMAKEGKTGACTVFDIPFGYLSPKSPFDLRKDLL